MKNRTGIKNQVLYVVLSCSIITLLIAGGIALYGMMKIKSDAVNIGMEIGSSAARNSSESLKEVSLASLQGLVHERSKQINSFFDRLAWEVTIMANEMNTILKRPQDYPARSVPVPDAANAGRNVPQLQYRAGADRAALAYEVGLTAHLQDIQVRFFDNDPTIGSNYVASVNGFNITVDAASDRRVDESNVPVANDYFAPYYNANGEIAGVVGEGKFLTDVSAVVNRTKMGRTGFAFVMNNKTGQILFSPREDGDLAVDSDDNIENNASLFDADDPELVAAARMMSEGEKGVRLVNIDDKPFYLAFTPLNNENWSFGVAIEEAEVSSSANISREEIERSTDQFVDTLNDSIKLMIVAIAAAFLATIVLTSFAGRRVADEMTKPILELSDGVREIASGNLDKKLDIHTGNEIEHLAVCFNAMTDELRTYMSNLTKVTAERERIATELNVATNIQESMLPHEFPPFPEKKEFALYATMQAAKEVGGDFYDFYLLDENHLIVTIADVSGKGVPAALFMVISKTILKNFAQTMGGSDDLAPLVSCSNDQLCQGNDASMFVTAFIGMLELSTGRFCYVNAGHNPPLVYRAATGKFEYMAVKRNFVMGGMDGLTYKGQEMTLAPGDRLFMYTDGVTEALNEDAELYGEERLINALNSADAEHLTLQELLMAVRRSLDEHVQTAAQSDDITMLALAYNGALNSVEGDAGATGEREA